MSQVESTVSVQDVRAGACSVLVQARGASMAAVGEGGM